MQASGWSRALRGGPFGLGHLRGAEGGVRWWNKAYFDSEQILADCVQGFLFLAQKFPGFFVADLSLAKLFDHVPDLGAVFV